MSAWVMVITIGALLELAVLCAGLLFVLDPSAPFLLVDRHTYTALLDAQRLHSAAIATNEAMLAEAMRRQR